MQSGNQLWGSTGANTRTHPPPHNHPPPELDSVLYAYSRGVNKPPHPPQVSPKDTQRDGGGWRRSEGTSSRIDKEAQLEK